MKVRTPIIAGEATHAWVCRKPNKKSVLVACENGAVIAPRVNLRDGHLRKPKRLKKKRIKHILAASHAAQHIFKNRFDDVVIIGGGITYLPWQGDAS